MGTRGDECFESVGVLLSYRAIIVAETDHVQFMQNADHRSCGVQIPVLTYSCGLLSCLFDFTLASVLSTRRIGEETCAV